MSDPNSQSRARRGLRGTGLRAFAAVLLLGYASIAAPEQAAIENRDPAETFGVDTPIGRVDYRLGRGLAVGDTRLTIGGFAVAEGERLEDGESSGGLDKVNFLLFFDPLPFVHLFSELEVNGLAIAQSGRSGVRSAPEIGAERVFGDFGANDALNLRLGKFLTPIGRWNPAPAEPFTWTTSDPLIVEEVFDETVTGGMVFGSVFPRGGTLSYSAYGTFFDPIQPDPDAPPAEHNAGAYLEWADLRGWSVGASYFASQAEENGWNHLGGVDGLWRPTGRVELSAEAVFGEGSRGEGGLFGLYAQAVVETVSTLYAVGRYERFDPPGEGRSLDLFDLGLAWVPVPSVRLKADYRFADHFDELSADLEAAGFRGSLSLIF
ncbi:MAG: hypothetical protein ACREQQ_14845 [Candidatus Binatia bacterium]